MQMFKINDGSYRHRLIRIKNFRRQHTIQSNTNKVGGSILAINMPMSR